MRSSRFTAPLCTSLAFVLAPMMLGNRGCEGGGGGGEVCTAEFAPVCGENGTTYANLCEADRAGVDVAHEGECAGGGACLAVYEPVCGSDGRTYPSACEAARASVRVERDGACACLPVRCSPDDTLRGCEFGHVRDAAGCETCECAPPPACLPVLCALACEHGFARDASGCETCECAEAPEACESDADCASGEACLAPPCALGICPPGEDCHIDCGPSVCVPVEGPRACSSDAECGEGAYCEIAGCLPVAGRSECAGTCTTITPPPPPPEAECVSDADCGIGGSCDTSACLRVGDLAVCGGVCERPMPTTCDADDDCGAGAHCEEIACAAVCPPGDADCAFYCPGGYCVADEAPPVPPRSCERDTDCLDGQACFLRHEEVACVRAPCPPVVTGTCEWIAVAF